MKANIVALLDRIAGTRLTTQEKELIADEAIKLGQEYNKIAAMAAMHGATEVIKQNGNH